MNKLKQLYYSPETGLQSAIKLHKKTRELGLKLTLKEIKEWVANQQTEQLIKTVKRPTKYNTIESPSVNNNYQMDIIVYDRYEYNNYKYILVVIDVYSRYVQAKAMTNRKMETIIKNVKEIFDVMGTPNNMNCDNEFNKTEFKSLMKKLNVTMWYSEPDEINKNAIVERFNRTLAALLQKWRISTNKYDWNKILPTIVKNYNNTYHYTIKNTPNSVFTGKKNNKQKIVRLGMDFELGDFVRIKQKKKIFDKGDALTLSKEIYTVSGFNKNKVEITDVITKKVQKQLYKSYELIKITETQHNDEPLEKKEEIIHKKIQKVKKTEKKNKKAGVDKKNIITVDKRVKKPKIIVEKEEEEYVVEKITDDSIDAKSNQKIYKVYWKGYKDPTWESYKNVKQTKAYEKYLKSKKNI